MKRRFALFLVIALLTAQLLCACSDSTSDVASGISMAEEKMSLSAIAVDNNLYVLGGITESGEIVADFAVYDLANNEWTHLDPMPVERAGAAVAHHGGRIYVFGGRGNAGLVSQVDVFDIASGHWESAGNMPYEAWNLSAEIYDGKIYVLGGISGTGNERRALSDAYIFDPVDQSWEQGPSLPAPRHDAASAVLNGRIYLIGGKEQTGSSAPAVDLVSFLDLETMQWGELAPLPSPRVGMKGATIDGKIYVAGGNSGGELFSSVDCYDLDADAWTEAAELSAPRMSHAVTAADNVLYVIGGSLNIPKSASDIRLTASIEAVSFAQDETNE
jgi:N-acetylneuraminic acid mutarotase